MGTGCQILVLIAKPNFVLFLISFALLSALLALNGVGRGDGSSSAGQGYWAGTSWNLLSLESRVGSLCRSLAPLTTVSPPLLSSHQHFLICFNQNQLDYLEPLIRRLKIILLDFGFVFFFPDVNQRGLRGCSCIHLERLSCWACPGLWQLCVAFY